MSQSLIRAYVHIVFSTKHRLPLINSKIEPELHRYIGGICKKLGFHPLAIGGCSNHIHMLCTLSGKTPISKLLEEVKSHSSKWMKTKGEQLRNFYWQNGYGAFSISHEDIEETKTYITNQHAHHDQQTFEQEFVSLLETNGIEYDERYLWD